MFSYIYIPIKRAWESNIPMECEIYRLIYMLLFPLNYKNYFQKY